MFEFPVLARGRFGVIAGDQCLRYGDFGFGFFGEGDANGIAQAVFEQRAYAHGRFNASVFTIASFCDAQMERIVHAFGHHFVYQQAIGLNHDLRIAGFHGKHDVVIVEVNAYPRKFKCGFDHAEWGVAKSAHNAV